MIISLFGEDTFRSRERLKALRDAFVKKYDPSGMNVMHLVGDSLKFEEFQSAVASQGFLSSRRFVVVDRPFDADRKTQEAIAEFIKAKSIPDESVVVFWNGEEKKKKKKETAEPSSLHAVLNRVKNRESFEPLESSEVERWILRRVKERGGSIDRTAAERLAVIAGSNLWLAANEIEKLLHHHDGRVTLRDVEANVNERIETSIFDFTDALSKKDGRRALELLEEQFASGANELYLLTMIARQIRILLSVADIAAEESNPATIASRLKLHPFVVRKALWQIRTFSQSELFTAHGELVKIDEKLKSTRENPKALLERFVLALCSR